MACTTFAATLVLILVPIPAQVSTFAASQGARAGARGPAGMALKSSPALFQTGAKLSKSPAPIIAAKVPESEPSRDGGRGSSGLQSAPANDGHWEQVLLDAFVAALGSAAMLAGRAVWRRRRTGARRGPKLLEFQEMPAPTAAPAKAMAPASDVDAWGCTALHHAAAAGDVERVRELLREDSAAVHAREALEDQPLHLAARAGSVGACTALLRGGADVNAANLAGETPLLAAATAATAGSEAVCRLLLLHGAGVGGALDCDLPPMLVSSLTSRILAGEAIGGGRRACEPPPELTPEPPGIDAPRRRKC